MNICTKFIGIIIMKCFYLKGSSTIYSSKRNKIIDKKIIYNYLYKKKYLYTIYILININIFNFHLLVLESF